MFSKHTSRRTSKSRDRMLELRVRSPRIFLFDAVKLTARLFKFSVFGAIVVALGFGIYLGYQKMFIENEEFALKRIDLTNEVGEEPQFMTNRSGCEHFYF
jgi:hypothetical protein